MKIHHVIALMGAMAGGLAAKEGDTDDRTRSEVDALFLELKTVFEEQDVDGFMERFSVADLFKAAEEGGLKLDIDEGGRAEFEKRGAAGFRVGVPMICLGCRFDEHRIMKLDREGDDKVVVLARFWDADLETFGKMRWWLKRNETGKWIAYDYEDLEQGARASVLMGAVLGGPGALDNAGWARPLMGSLQGLQALMQGQLDEAGIENLIASADKIIEFDGTPVDIVSMAYGMKFAAEAQGEDMESALNTIDAWEKVTPDSMMVHYSRGITLMGLEKWKGAIASFEKYADILGWDVEICAMTSDCYLALGEREKAEAFARRGLKDFPRSPDCVLSLVLALPTERMAEAAPSFDAFPNPEERWEQVVSGAIYLDPDAARALIKVMSKALPDSKRVKPLRRQLRRSLK